MTVSAIRKRINQIKMRGGNCSSIDLTYAEYDELKEEIKELCKYKTGVEDSEMYVMGVKIDCGCRGFVTTEVRPTKAKKGGVNGIKL